MGLFGKPKTPAPPKVTVREPEKPAPTVVPEEPLATETVVAGECLIEGQIAGRSDIRIVGRVTGEVTSQGTVLVMKNGAIRGDVHGRLVTIAGLVEGNVSAEERVELKPTGNLTGDITAPRVHIAEGATFEGQVFMGGRKSRSQAGSGEPAGETRAAGGRQVSPERKGQGRGKKPGRRS